MCAPIDAGVSAIPIADPPQIRVLLACDVRLYREGLAAGLAARPWITVVGAAPSAADAVAAARQCAPELVLLDMAMPGSLSAVRSIRSSLPGVKVFALGIQEDPDVVVRCAEAGLLGYVPRDASLDDLVAAIERGRRGEVLASPLISASLMRHVTLLAERQRQAGSATSLTQRESEVLALVDQGLSNKEIARRLAIGLTTVKNHVHRILEKLQVSRRGAAAAHVRGRSRALEAISRTE